MRPFAILAAGVIAAATLAAAGAAETPPTADEALAQSRLVSYQLRAGQYDLAPKSVAALEAAVAADPRDVRLWNALGTAYYQQIMYNYHGGKAAEIPGALQKAVAAHARALEIAPADPEALSGHGTGLAIAAGFTRRPEMGRQGIAEMNRASGLAPDSTVIRLQRAFTNLGVSADLRDVNAAETDLAWLIKISDGSQPGDVLHVLLGDLYAEGGKPDLARPHYRAAARKGSATQAVGAARLTALKNGPLPLTDFTRLRSEIGRNCVMCHGS